MEDYKTTELQNESFIAMIASTFGSGEPPDNGKVITLFVCIIKSNGNNLNYSLNYSFCLITL